MTVTVRDTPTNKRRALPFIAAGLVGLIAAVAVYWSLQRPRLNVILVTLDTTRADHLGIYGYENGLTTEFDEFARRGVVFDRAYAPAPLTLPAHATMLTGLYPPEHGLRMNGSGRLDEQLPLLPEILKKQGYDTAAFVAAAVLKAQYGLDRGFDTYDDALPPKRTRTQLGEARRDAQEIVDPAMAWIGKHSSRPFFCWLHLYDAHGPYDARPELYEQRFADRPYDAGIAREVSQFGRLLAFLREQKLDKNTLVVVTADHGEGLNEHLEAEHGMLVYNTTLRVPLVFVGPGVCLPETRVNSVVSLADLTPTILDLLGIPLKKHLSGRSLAPALKGERIDSRDCYGETNTPFFYNHWSPLQTLISERWKYIHTSRPELYDLENDPGELTNLFDSEVDQRKQMQNLLELMQESFVRTSAQNLTLTEKDRANLQALGYVSGGKLNAEIPDSNDVEALPDIKDMLPLLVKFDQARHLSMQGQLNDSIALLQEIVHTTNSFSAAGMLLGETLAQSGKLDEAITVFQNVLVQRPDFVNARFSLGKILSAQGHYEEAATQFKEFLKQNQNAATCHFELAQALVRLGKLDDALFEYREAVRLAPEFAVANIQLGQLLMSLGRLKEAQVCFERAIEHEPNLPLPYAHLLIILAQTGRSDEAIEYGRKAIALEPASFEHRFNLGVFLIAQRRFAEGIALMKEAQSLRPDDPRPAQQIQQAEAAQKMPGR